MRREELIRATETDQKAPRLSMPEHPNVTPRPQLSGPEATFDLSGPEHAPEYSGTGQAGPAPKVYQTDVPVLTPETDTPDDLPAPHESTPQYNALTTRVSRLTRDEARTQRRPNPCCNREESEA